MKNTVIRELSAPELKERLEDTTSTLNKLKLNHAVSPLENPMKIRDARNLIARLKTEIRSRQIQEAKNLSK